MSKAKFTKGPWRAVADTENSYTINDESGIEVAEVWCPEARGKPTANAHLIAAAPEMYAALERLASSHDEACEAVETGCWCGVKEARAVLAEARGES